MRRAYRNTIRRLLRRRDRPWAGWLLKALTAHIPPGLIRPLTAPLLATLEVTRRCNLACRHCESRLGSAAAPETGWMTSFIREAGAAGVVGLGFTGGEPLILDDFESLALEGRAAGLVTHLNTNGTLVTQDRACRLLETGLASVNVSLDGSDGTVHDRLRGSGSFARAVSGIEHLVRARASTGVDLRILLVMTLSEDNAGQALDLLSLAGDLGVDGCSYLPLALLKGEGHPSGSPAGSTGTGSPARSPAAGEAAKALSARAGDPMLDNSKKYLGRMAGYFMGDPMPARCSALHTSILVSADRRLYPCVPSAVRRTGGVTYQPGDLMASFRSGDLASAIDPGLCGGCWWNCHRELDLALGVI